MSPLRHDRDLPLTPLAPEEMSPAVLRTVGPAAPAPMKMMAARGLSPLPPPELVVALYQLFATSDDTMKKTARESAGKLPEPVLRAALSGPLDARVLDFLSRQLFANRLAVELLLRNRGLSDLSAEHLAAACGVDELELLATDEQRLLRAPGIIAALYMNPRARASTALRAVELAARNGVTVDIPGFEDVVTSLRGVTLSAEDDARFQAVVPPAAPGAAAGTALAESAAPAEVAALTQEDIERTQAAEEAAAAARAGGEPEPEAAEKGKRFDELAIPLQIRAATLGTAFDRSLAIRSSVRLVCMAAIRSPALTVNEVVKFAANRALHEDVIRYISNQKDWTQLGSIRLALINNNKCPLGTSMRFLAFLNARDLKAVSRSKNIPGPLVKAAKELITKRERK